MLIVFSDQLHIFGGGERERERARERERRNKRAKESGRKREIEGDIESVNPFTSIALYWIMTELGFDFIVIVKFA